MLRESRTPSPLEAGHGGASQRTREGARLATISVVAGVIATLASVFAVAYVASVGSSIGFPRGDGTRLASHVEQVASVDRQASLASEAAGDAGGRPPVREHAIGELVLVDVGPEIASLDEELAHQARLAAQDRARMLVWLVVEDCKACRAFESALTSPAMQRALPRARLVRLNAADFLPELSRLGVPMDAFPGFVLFGATGRAADYVHSGEWDGDVPENIAPVLKSFVEGTYSHRRIPWRGGVHDDETAI